LPTPIFNFASSGVLQKQIQKGAPMDVFVSAAAKQMDVLERAGLLLPGSRRDILNNDLLLVVPSASNVGILSIPGLTADSVRRIAIGDGGVPAGDYARQVLFSFGLSNVLQGKLVPLGSVRAVANAVAAGDVDAGFVYRSDVQNVANLRIVLAAPPKSHLPIRYSAAVIKSSVQPQQAKAYLSSLTTPQASQLLKRYGLIPFSCVGVTSGTK
jgi:molybdate transport system substrate-binding protein